MVNLIRLLIVLLIVQIGIVAWVNRPGDELHTFNATEPLMEVDAPRVDRLVIDGPGQASVVIERKDGNWILPDSGNFPVSPKKLERVLEKLLAVKRSWPVGKTLVAAKQLKVAADEFERRIRLFSGEELLGDVYLGSSPGFRKVHARLDGAANTYAIDFNAFDAPTEPSDWYDRDLLRISESEVERIDMGSYALVGGDKGFVVEGLQSNERTRTEKAQEIVRAVTSLGFTDELGKKGKEVFEQGDMMLEFAVKPKGGAPVDYTVVGSEEEDHYVLKTSKFPYHFKVGKKKFDDLREVSRLQLVEDKASQTAEDSGVSEAAPETTTP